MKIAVFNTKPYDREFLEIANRNYNHSLTFFETHLKRETVSLARGFPAVCIFVNDRIDAPMFEALAANGTRLVALRCSGFNNVDLVEAEKHEIMVVRVPAYSPYAVAEHTIALLLGLNRKLHKSYARVREGNFALDGLLGYDVHGRTAGIIGTGRIGMVVAKILHGFGCSLRAYDPHRNAECERYGVRYTSLNELLSDSDIITLHCPLTPETYHIIDSSAVEQMKHGAILINTSRGALIDTRAIIRGLKSGKISQLGLDVYEEEADLFFEDLSDKVIQDDVFARLLTFPNVVVTGHQAYFTREALMNIAEVTLANIQEYEKTGTCSNRVTAREVKG